MNFRQAFLSAAVSGLAVACLCAGVAIAGGPAQGGVPMAGCKTDSTGALRVLLSGGACKAGESKLIWNKPGAQWMGNWSNTSTYASPDEVSYSGSTWLAAKTGKDDTPVSGSAYWNQVASRGDQGPPGGKGPTGTPGDPDNGAFTEQTGTLGDPVGIGTKLNYWRPMGTMTIHSAIPSRPYAVMAKLDVYDWSNNATVSCRLVANNDTDLNTVTIYNDNATYDYQPMSLMVVHDFTPTDNKVLLECAANQTGAEVENISVTGIAGSTLINTAIN